jgi:CelD/BcsL family acetyltransferase involved in cellulose biosynthesis
VTLHDRSGTLRAGAPFCLARGGLHATFDAHAARWGVVAHDDDDARALWKGIAALPFPTLALAGMDDGPRAADAARALQTSGRRVHRSAGLESPFAALPPTFDELLAQRSANLRSQVRRRGRALQRRGDLRLRTVRGPEALGPDLDAFLRIEASGWKADAGTAILGDPRAERLYREFARRAARLDLLRLHLLELDGEAIAGDLSCRLGRTEFLVKTAYADDHASVSPGLVLRAEVLRLAIDEGMTGYDFLGGPDGYKLRWTDELRGRVTLRGFRGARALPAEAWWRAGRPTAARVRRELERVRS